MIRRSVKRAVQRLHAAFGNVKKETFDFDLIENYYAKKNNSEAAQVISDRTCNDLDFHELFKFVDRTHSKVGQQYLYNKLRTIPLNPADNSKDNLDFPATTATLLQFPKHGYLNYFPGR